MNKCRIICIETLPSADGNFGNCGKLLRNHNKNAAKNRKELSLSSKNKSKNRSRLALMILTQLIQPSIFQPAKTIYNHHSKNRTTFRIPIPMNSSLKNCQKNQTTERKGQRTLDQLRLITDCIRNGQIHD